MVDIDSISVADDAPVSEEMPAFSQDATPLRINDQLAHFLWMAASHLTDPVCRAHEYWRRTFVVQSECPQAHQVVKYAKKAFLYLGIYGWGNVAVFTTAPAFLLRYIARRLQTEPFMAQHAPTAHKVLAENGAFTIFSWNICAPGGGYASSDGGVAPCRDRLDAVVDKVLEKNTDISCLFEVFDIKAAAYNAVRQLEHWYTHIF